ncbi:hypothetical protein EV401DRAFT_2201055 [Pisolithus croceorrhizus]|nr:hypothetical protein EV401DRAFT_2201055 [Pisolithus croceorrhizus]
MSPHHGLNLGKVIWNYSTPDLCVLHDALLGGSLNREISRCCHMVSENLPRSAGQIHSCQVSILDTLHVSFMCHTLYYYLVINYGVPTSFEYVVWSYAASGVAQLLVIVTVQLFFAHKIYRLCRRGVRWLVTAPIDLAWYYSVTPSAASVVVAEVLITVSLCVILYDGGSYSGCARAKRLIKTLITYAANRCLLTSIVLIGELVVNVDQQAVWTMGFNFIVGKSSLNAREHLRSQGSPTTSTLNIDGLHFADPPTPPKDGRNSKDEERRFDVHELADTDISSGV